jgi:RNA polymerase sigma-70 factor (ECF subfamily)
VQSLTGNDEMFASAGLFVPPRSRRVSRDEPRLDGTSGPPPDVSRLTALMAKNDEAAFREFHELYFNRLLRYLLVLNAGREDAARDALQATLLRVVRHARRFDSEPVFWSWLTVLARSSVVDAERKRSRYQALLERFFHNADPAPPTTDAEAENRLMSLLEKNLDELAMEDRALIDQKYFAGESVRDIAATQGATEKAIESRLVRIRRQLREAVLKALKHEK